MPTWIEKAEEQGRQASCVQEKSDKALKDAQKKFAAEVVTENAAAKYLEPFVPAVLIVGEELRQKGYGVVDGGFQYNFYVADPKKYALTTKRDGGHKYDVAYGRMITITAPDGGALDTVGLLPMVDEETHFAKVGVITESGWGTLLYFPGKVDENAADVRKMIGARITQYFAEHPRVGADPVLH